MGDFVGREVAFAGHSFAQQVGFAGGFGRDNKLEGYRHENEGNARMQTHERRPTGQQSPVIGNRYSVFANR